MDVVLHRRQCDEQLVRDLLIRQAVFDQIENLELARAQPRLRLPDQALLGRQRGHPVHERGSDLRRAGELVPGHGAYRVDQVSDRPVSRDIAGSADLGPGKDLWCAFCDADCHRAHVGVCGQHRFQLGVPVS
jgi:hypothetical protein